MTRRARAGSGRGLAPASSATVPRTQKGARIRAAAAAQHQFVLPLEDATIDVVAQRAIASRSILSRRHHTRYEGNRWLVIVAIGAGWRMRTGEAPAISWADGRGR